MRKILRAITMCATLLFAGGLAVAETTVLLDVDFSEKCIAGSEEAPQMFKYSSDFTSASGLGYTGWSLSSASGIGQAGGSLFISDGAYIRTPYLSGVSTSNGAIKVTMVVKLNNTNMGIAQLKWGYSLTENYEIYTADWTTVEYMITPTSTSSYSNYGQICPYLVADGMFVKSVKIEQSPEFLGVPVAYLPSDATGTSFTAKWKTVSGATKYLLDVYSYDNEGNKVMFVENVVVTPTSSYATSVTYKVEGLNPEIKYYYVVRSANDVAVSNNSAEIEVVKTIYSLETPEVTVNANESGSYTAQWNAVPDAESYLINVVCRKTLAEPSSVNILSESFNCFTTGTIDNYEYAYDRHLAMLGDAGWTGKNMSYINGAIGLTPYTGDESYIITPALNLSDDSGNVTVLINAAATTYGSFTTSTIGLALLDAEDNVLSEKVLDLDVNEFNQYSVTLENGTSEAKVKIYDVAGNSTVRFFFDEVVVSQVKPAGYVNTFNYISDEVTTTEYAGTIDVVENAAYYISVTASAITSAGGSLGNVYSDPSEEKLIAEFSGVENVAIDRTENVTFSSLGFGMIEVVSEINTIVDIYDLAGRKIFSAAVSVGVNTIDVNTTGVVIAKAGCVASKIVL